MDIDHKDGNQNDILEYIDFDAFYDENDYEHTTNQEESEVMLYIATSAVRPNNPEGYTHAARRHECNCGAGKWLMYESKCGDMDVIEHRKNQLNGDPDDELKSRYGRPFRYYKHK